MKLRWTSAARQDRDLIYAYVEADNPQAAIDLDSRVEECAGLLTRLPNIGRVGRVAGTRELSVSDQLSSGLSP